MMNNMGLTFARWFYAANFGRKVPVRHDVAVQAWRKGEDPTQYACE